MLRTLATLAALAAFPLAATAEDLVLVRDGKPLAAIVVAKEALAKKGKEASAAAELQHYLEKISGAKIPIVSEAEAPRGPLVLVGKSKLADVLNANIPSGLTPARREEGFLVLRKGDRLLLAGNDAGPYHGTEYAVAEFLERLGVRWFMPGDFGEVVPKMPTVAVGELKVRQKPDFVMRNWWHAAPPPMQEQDRRWRLRNKMNPDAAFAVPGDSSVRALLPAEAFKAHPEAFATNADGTRNPHMPSLTHPKAVEIVADGIKAHFRKHPGETSYGFAPDDGMPRDYSAPNRGFPEVYGRPGVPAELSISEEWFTFVNNVTRAVRKDFPDAYIATNGYANRNTPPQGVPLDDHLVVMFAAIWSDTLHAYDDPKAWQSVRQGQMLREWSRLCKNVWVYNYDYTMLASALTPVPRVSKLRRDFPLMKKWGGMGFSNESRHVWMEEGIATKYLRAKLAWNADVDVDALLDDFYARWYGKAAKPARAFWEALEKVIRETPMQGHEDRILPFVYTPELVAELERHVAGAERAVGDGREKQRVRADRLILEHLKAYMAMQAAEFAGDFAAAAVQARKMMDHRKELHGIHSFYCMPHEDNLQSGVYYWGVVARAKYYDSLADRLSGKTGTKVALLAESAPFRTDPHDEGRFEGWYEPGFDDKGWKPIKTTEPFYRQGFMDQRGHTYLGDMWYRFRVDVPAAAKGRPVTLYFPTVESEAWVWVNGKFVGHRAFHEAYERPNAIEMDVTAALKPGESNVIAVRVNTGLNAAMLSSGLLSRGFLYSPVKK